MSMYTSIEKHHLKMSDNDSKMTSYRSKKYHGQVAVMELTDDHSEGTPSPDMAASEDLQAMVRAIQTDDLDQLASLLNSNSGKNISLQLVACSAAKKWRGVIRNIRSTPLRVAVAWRNSKALAMILSSKCVVDLSDLCVSLQKSLRYMESHSEIAIIEQLVRNGATVENPAHFTVGFGKTMGRGDTKLCYLIMQGICRSKPSNNLLGQMLLATARCSSRVTDEAAERVLADKWAPFASRMAKTVLRVGFDPGEFFRDTKVWLSFGRTSFQHQILLLPLMVQVMNRCPVLAFGWLLRQTSRYYPHVGQEGKAKIRQVPRLLWEAGVNVPAVMKVASLSPRFMADTGLDVWTKRHRNTVRTLQQHCRQVIRANLRKGNVWRAVEKMPYLPRALRDFLLLRDIQALPWDDDVGSRPTSTGSESDTAT